MIFEHKYKIETVMRLPIKMDQDAVASSGVSSSPASLARSLASLAALSDFLDLRLKMLRLRVDLSAEGALEAVLSTLFPSWVSLARSSSMSPCEESPFLEKRPDRSFHELNLLELPLRVSFRMNDSFEAPLSRELLDGTRSRDS